MLEHGAASPKNNELVIPAAERLLHTLVKSQERVDNELLAKAIRRYADLPEVHALVTHSFPGIREDREDDQNYELQDLTNQIGQLANKPGALEDFAVSFAEAVFLNGAGKPARILDATYDLLRKVGQELVALRSLEVSGVAPESAKMLETLKKLDRELMNYVRDTEHIKSDDYGALNQQHRIIARAIRHEEQAFLQSVPAAIRQKLETSGPLSLTEVRTWSKDAQAHVAKLVTLGIIHQSEIAGAGPVLAFARAEVSSDHFECVIPPRVREQIGHALRNEFCTKYSGKLRPLGIAENRDAGVPTLNDRLRLKKVADEVGVSVAHIVLTLKYLEKHALVRVDHTGYCISELGMKVGLGMRAVRIMQRTESRGGVASDKVTIERYLDAVKNVRSNWKTPTYQLSSGDGGAPWIYLVDELYAGNARIDAELLRNLIKDIRENPRALVVASNMLQGHPAVDHRAMRTSLPPSETDGIDLRDYDAQVKFVRALLASLGHPVLQLHGKVDLETANLRTDVQRVRDQYALLGEEKPSEGQVKAALGRVNEITYRAGRKFNAKMHAEILDFMAQVVMPLELKLGRQLFDSNTIEQRTGLDLNEFEILRDIAGELLHDRRQATDQGLSRIRALYADFFALEEIGDKYLHALEEVLFPEKERLQPGQPVARGGGSIQFLTDSGEKGLSMVCLPEFRFGVSEAQNPTAKLVELIKSRTLAGRDMPDIVVTGATGQAYVSMTAGGTLIVSAASLQASNYDDSFLHTEAQDRHKRRRTIAGGEASAGSIAFSGGVDEGIKTDAYTLRLWNNKIREVLEENARLGRPPKQVDIYATSDWQIGSPTAKPATMLRGLFWAVMSGKKEIVINGDAFQGQNYGRAPAEMQLTGLVGIEDQQAFVYALLNPVLDMIRRMREADPGWEIPKFKILVGNHETNSQSGKGLQGIWFLQTVASQVQSFYRGAFGKEVAESHVVYPKKFVDRLGVDVDYSHMVLDHTDTTGFRIGVQHYVGAGAKGSTSVPPISAAKTWARSMENELRPLHGFLMGHWHTQSVTMGDGLFHVIFGANADKSGFEWHLGYPTTVPASGVLRLYSDRPPEIFFVTDPYLRLQEKELFKEAEYRALLEKHGSIEGFVEYERARHQRRDQGAMNYGELRLADASHSFIDPQRKVA